MQHRLRQSNSVELKQLESKSALNFFNAIFTTSCFASRTTGLPGKKEGGELVGPDHDGGRLLGGKIVLLQIELELGAELGIEL